MKVEVILAPGTDADTALRVATLAEDLGLDGLWAASFPAERDPFMTLVPAARATRRLRLGVLPMSPFEKHPVKIADSLLTLHELSGARAALLVGGLGKSGSYAMKIEPRRRVRAVADCVKILQGACSGQPFEYAGELYSCGRYHAPWAPSVPPQIYVAANGERMLRMAGALADGVMLSDATEGLMPPILAALEAGQAAAGRAVTPFPVSNFWAWHIKQDREQSMAEARRELVWRGALLRSHISHCLAPQDVAFVESHWQSFYQAFVRRSEVIEGVPARIVQALIDGLTFAGDANDVPRAAARLRSLEAAGQTQIALRLFDDPEAGVRSIGELLLPQLARHDPNPLTGAQAWK